MGKLNNIIQGWKNDYKDKRGLLPPEIKEIFDERLKICRSNECGKLELFVCGACGCPIKKKAKALTETCPVNMWKPTIYKGDDEEQFILVKEVPPQLRSLLIDYSNNTLDEEGAVFLEDWNTFLAYMQEHYL